MPPFQDHFSTRSPDYAAHRPCYPAAFFDFVASLAPAHNAVWDAGTGSGQAAVELTRHFKHVIATDASANQIENAQPHDRIEYRVAFAEDSGLEDASVDAITVAQALHWFNLPEFVTEARRVARAGAPLVACTYGMPRISAAIDPHIDEFHNVTVGPYWPTQRNHPQEGYTNLHLPLDPVTAPVLEMRSDWTLDQFLNYVRTWSAVKRYAEAHATDPVSAFEQRIAPVWDAPGEAAPVVSPLTVKAWRIH